MSPLRKTLVAIFVASLGAFSALALTACSDDDITGNEAEEQVSVALREFDISPERVEVSKGKIEFVVNNEGDRAHELAIRTESGVERSGVIEPGDTGRMTVDLPDGRYRMYDPRADYRSRGMRATVIVTDATRTVTERTVERTVVEDEPDVNVPEVQEPEVQEPDVQPAPPPQAPPPPPPPPPPATVTQVVPAPEEPTTSP